MPYETKVTLKIINSGRELNLKCNLIQACIILFASKAKHSLTEEDFIINLTLEKAFVQKFLNETSGLIVEQTTGSYKFNWEFVSPDDMVDLDSKIK